MELTLNKQSALSRFTACKATTVNGSTRANLLRILRSADLIGRSSREESGRLDRRGFVRFSTGDANIFSRRDVKEAEKAAVQVLVDCSGSMGSSMSKAQEVTIALGDIFDKAKVAFSVTGFTTGSTSSLGLVPIKAWGETFRQAATILGSIDKFCIGGTPDYQALHWGIEQLVKRNEGKKVLFIITDACGYRKHEMDQINKIAKSFGVTIVAIGIGRTDVETFFQYGVNVRNAKELGGQAFNTLLRAVK
jgi:cobalamin biosynthesis protein CobT